MKHLFSPVNIGNMTVKNRILMPAMSVNFGVDENGYITEQLIEYLAKRAEGGTGMIIVGGGAVDIIGRELPNLPALWEDGCIPGLKKAAEKVHQFGAKLGMQVFHGGRQVTGEEKVAPSPIPAAAISKGIPRELTINEIKHIIEEFGDSAKRCMLAGFDFAEIHAAHGYLINQFMSPNSNIRTDKYGGSFENRIRFLIAVFENIKQKTGDSFPVGVRFNGDDYMKDGWTLDKAVDLAVLLEKSGADYLSISGGVYGSSQLTIPSMYVAHGCFTHLAKAVKQKVSVPVVTAGRIKNPEMADQLIKNNIADITAMGRSHLADPEITNKAQSGNLAKIRPCIGCCLGCINSVFDLEPATCVVNPELGREYLFKNRKKTAKPKKILIIGAGPAGLSAAVSLSEQGHNVIILEQSGYIGGTARLASLVPGRGEIMDIINYFINCLNELNIEIRLNIKPDIDIINKISPDQIIEAAGSLTDIPVIKGLSKTGMQLLTSEDILQKNSIAGDKVIIIGGCLIGLVTADYLAEKGRQVTVLHRSPHFAEDMSRNDRFYLRSRLIKNNVVLYKNAVLKNFSEYGAVFTINGEENILENFDTVVFAEKRTPVKNTSALSKKSGSKTSVIGDASKPRNIMFAIAEGRETC